MQGKVISDSMKCDICSVIIFETFVAGKKMNIAVSEACKVAKKGFVFMNPNTERVQ